MTVISCLVNVLFFFKSCHTGTAAQSNLFFPECFNMFTESVQRVYLHSAAVFRLSTFKAIGIVCFMHSVVSFKAKSCIHKFQSEYIQVLSDNKQDTNHEWN